MGQVSKFTNEQSFKDRLKSHGFCLDDPDRRYPTRNDLSSQVLALSTRSAPGKAAMLLQARKGRDDPGRSRLLPWLAPALGWVGWPERAMAHDHHPPLLPPIDLPSIETLPVLDSALNWLHQLDPTDPIWTVSLLGSLLVTQAVGIFQRRALLRASVARVEAAQLDLFPETLAEEKAETDASHTQWRWKIDAATRQGQVRDENQDALEVMRFSDDVAVLVVCDGAGGIGGGRKASQSAVAIISETLKAIWHDKGKLTPADLDTAVANARNVATEENLQGVTTALLVLLDGDIMHYATLGDGAIAVIWPDGMIGPVQVPHHTLGRPSNEIGAYIGAGCEIPARSGGLRLEGGCFVLAMTDGASDLFTFEDFALARDKTNVVPRLADSVLAHLEAARDPETGAWLHSDNMTLAIAQLAEGGGDDAAH